MPGRAAAGLHPHLARRQVDLVMDDEHVGRRELVEAHRLADGAARLVHVGERLEKEHLLARQRSFGDLAVEAPPPRAEPVTAVNRIGGHEADIVPVPGVVRARIAEAGNEEHDTAPGSPLRGGRLLLAAFGLRCAFRPSWWRRRPRPRRRTGLGGLLGNAGGSGSRFGGSAQLFLDAGRRRDRRDREVAGDGRPDALRQRDPRDVERVVDVEAGQVGDDLVRDGVRRAEQLDPVADDVEHAATA